MYIMAVEVVEDAKGQLHRPQVALVAVGRVVVVVLVYRPEAVPQIVAVVVVDMAVQVERTALLVQVDPEDLV